MRAEQQFSSLISTICRPMTTTGFCPRSSLETRFSLLLAVNNATANFFYFSDFLFVQRFDDRHSADITLIILDEL